MSMTKDILLKAAEDVTQGMWCRGAWFTDRTDPDHVSETAIENAETLTPADIYGIGAWRSVETLQAKYRCAEGSVHLASVILGGTLADGSKAIQAVEARLEEMGIEGKSLVYYNDDMLPPDPFEAGQQLAELFRSVAEEIE